MAEFFALFAVGTLWFWVLWAAILVFMVWTTEQDFSFLSVVGAILIALILWMVYDFNVITYVLHNPKIAIIALVGYFVSGCLWALVKWGFFVQTVMDVSKPLREKLAGPQKVVQTQDGKYVFEATYGGNTGFLVPNSVVTESPGSEIYQKALMEAIKNYTSIQGYAFPPHHGREKGRITYWIGFWPFSLLWWLVNKPIYYISTFIYNRMAGVMSKITSWVISANLKQ